VPEVETGLIQEEKIDLLRLSEAVEEPGGSTLDNLRNRVSVTVPGKGLEPEYSRSADFSICLIDQ
jgi:hypothetical protein